MTNGLVDLLRTARGESCQVIAVFVDVRGFSSFAGVAESTDTAQFLRTIYSKILEDYFPTADFVKPTGDGLMLIRELDPEAEKVIEEVQHWVQASLSLVADFPTLTDDDVLLNVPVPAHIGIGVARGSATKLIGQGDTTIDYSGRCLNLAARLMDLSRPEGVVFHDRHATALLGSTVDAMFMEQVYVKGIDDTSPLTIHASTGLWNNNLPAKEPFIQPMYH